MDLDEERPELPHARRASRRPRPAERASRAADAALESSRRRSASTRSRRGPGRRRRGDRRRSGGARRRTPRPLGRAAPLAPPASGGARRSRRQARGTWTSQRSTRLPSRSAANGSQMRRPVAATALLRWYVSNRSGVPSGARIGQVHLVQVALAALEAVLGACEVAQLGAGRPRAQDVELRRVEREGRADEPRLVGVHDAAVARPDLDPDDPLAEHALLDDPVDGIDRLGARRAGATSDRRLDDALARERRRTDARRGAPRRAPGCGARAARPLRRRRARRGRRARTARRAASSCALRAYDQGPIVARDRPAGSLPRRWSDNERSVEMRYVTAGIVGTAVVGSARARARGGAKDGSPRRGHVLEGEHVEAQAERRGRGHRGRVRGRPEPERRAVERRPAPERHPGREARRE